MFALDPRLLFQRLGASARRVIFRSLEEAAAWGGTAVGPEHLLAAVAGETGSVAAMALGEAGVTSERIRQVVEAEDAQALASIGISLDTVRRKIEQTAGAEAWSRSLAGVVLPFTPAGKDAVNSTVRESRQLRHRVIEAEHILLALVGHDGPVDSILRTLGVVPADVRQRLLSELTRTRVG